jgi:hypothetical protein
MAVSIQFDINLEQMKRELHSADQLIKKSRKHFMKDMNNMSRTLEKMAQSHTAVHTGIRTHQKQAADYKKLIQITDQTVQKSISFFDAATTSGPKQLADAFTITSKVFDGISEVAGKFGPMGEMIGGIASGIKNVVKAIGDRIPKELSTVEKLRISWEKQKTLLESNLSLIKQMRQVNSSFLDQAWERSKQLREEIRLQERLTSARGSSWDVTGKSSDELIDKLEQVNRTIANSKAGIKRAEIRGGGDRDDLIGSYEDAIQLNEELKSQIEGILELHHQLHESLKDENSERLAMLDQSEGLGRSEFAILQQKQAQYRLMLEQKDTNGALLYGEQERYEIMVQMGQIQQELLDTQQALERSRLRQKGYDTDSLTYIQAELQHLSSSTLDPKVSGKQAFDTLVAEFGGIVDAQQYLQNLSRESMADMVVYAQERKRLSPLIHEALNYDPLAYNTALEQQQQLTKQMIDRYFSEQERQITHEFTLGSLTESERDSQLNALIREWQMVYQKNEQAVQRITTDIASRLQIPVSDLQLDMANLIISDEDQMKLTERLHNTIADLSDLITDSATWKDISKELAMLQHQYAIGEVEESTYLAEQLALLKQQYALIPEGIAYQEERWKMEEEIYRLMQKQTETLEKQDALHDAMLNRLFRQRHQLLQQRHSGSENAQPDITQQIHQLEQEILHRMAILGVDDVLKQQTAHAMRQQTHYADGGWVSQTGSAVVHQGEFVLPATSASILHTTNPGFLDSLQQINDVSELDRFLNFKPVVSPSAIPNAGFLPPSHIHTTQSTYHLGGNQFIIHATDAADVEKRLRKWETNFNDRVVEVIQKKAVLKR